MTPSAARGVLEAIFWKPEFSWIVKEIHVLKPIRRISILRNEVKTCAAPSTVKKWINKGEGNYFADDDRTQRHTLALRDVAYLIVADMRLSSHATDPIIKYKEIFRRRLKKGQCFHQPYLGCREFSCSFEVPTKADTPIQITDALGTMLLDMDFEPDSQGKVCFYAKEKIDKQRKLVKGRITPRFFRASLDNGILHVPVHGFEMEIQ
jgi:CRISPR-associated protein Cas5d